MERYHNFRKHSFLFMILSYSLQIYIISLAYAIYIYKIFALKNGQSPLILCEIW